VQGSGRASATAGRGRNPRRELELFHALLHNTYRAHHSTPYLNLEFFRRLGETLPEHLLMVLAELDGRPIASALNVFSPEVLYGRYWGLGHACPAAAFRVCYYQALDFCIERGIRIFEGGAQGEHKLARGFMPNPTWSAHWLRHPEFSDAVEKFLARESQGIERYVTSSTNEARSGQRTRSAYLFLGGPQSSAATWRRACRPGAGPVAAGVAEPVCRES